MFQGYLKFYYPSLSSTLSRLTDVFKKLYHMTVLASGGPNRTLIILPFQLCPNTFPFLFAACLSGSRTRTYDLLFQGKAAVFASTLRTFLVTSKVRSIWYRAKTFPLASLFHRTSRTLWTTTRRCWQQWHVAVWNWHKWMSRCCDKSDTTVFGCTAWRCYT